MECNCKKFDFSAIYHNIWGQWLIPAIITLLDLGFIFAFIPIVCMVHDDPVMMGYFNGSMAGTPLFFHTYVNPIFSFFMGTLYTITAAVNWYMLYCYSLFFLGVTTLGFCILRLCNRKGINFWKAVLLFIWLLVGLFFYPMYTPTFTFSATCICTSAVALIFTVDPQYDSHKIQICSYILCVFFLFLGAIYRFQSAEPSLCFFILGLIYRILKSRFCGGTFKTVSVKRLYLCAVAILIMIVGLQVLKEKEKEHFHDFYKLNAAHWRLIDYEHPSYDNKEMRQTYDSLGMTKEFVTLMDDIAFADEKVTSDNLWTIVKTIQCLNHHSLEKTIRNGINLMKHDKFALSAAMILGVIGCYAIWLALLKGNMKKYWLEFLTALCALGGVFLLSIYLCFLDRFIHRSFLPVTIPATTSIILLIIYTMEPQKNLIFSICNFCKVFQTSPKKTMIYKVAMTGICFFAILLTCYKPVHYAFHPDTRTSRRDILEKDKSTWTYIKSHPQNIYMYKAAASPHLNLFPENNFSRTNAISCGDVINPSPMLDVQLYNVGRKNFYYDALLEKNVFLFSEPYFSDDIAYDILNYMCQEYYTPAMKVVDKLSDTQIIYQYLPLEIEKNYTGWIHAYGRSYYIKDGDIQTGWFQIGKEKYFGIPSVTTYDESKWESDSIQYYSLYSQKIDNEDYIISTGNSVATGWMYIDGDTYFFDSEGVMQTGWAYSEDFGWRYLKVDGKLLHDDWLVTENRQYYFDSNGQIYTVAFEGKLDTIPLPQGATVWKGFDSK